MARRFWVSRFANRMAVCLGLLLMSACTGDAGGSFTESDSAGVRVVHTTSPLWGNTPLWRISAEPALEIGHVEGASEYLFSGAHSPTKLSDGRIAVGDMGSGELRYYDATGRFLMRRGREGQGPGEWDQLYQMRRGGGDSIQIIEPVNEHSIFSPAGDYVRRFSLEPVRNRPNIWAVGRLANGTMLAYSLAPPGDRVGFGEGPGEEAVLGRDTSTRPTGFYREMYQHFAYTPEGKVIDSIGILPGRGQHGGAMSAPFQPRGYYAVSGDSLFFGVGDAYEVRVYEVWVADTQPADRPGIEVGTPETPPQPRAGMRLTRILRRDPRGSLAMTPEIMEADKKRERERLEETLRRRPGMPISIERTLERRQYPATVPAHGRILVDLDGHVWLQEYVMPGAEDDSTRWNIFDPRGRWLGIVPLPPRFNVSEIGRDYVLGIWRDELDVQRVRMYRLSRT